MTIQKTTTEVAPAPTFFRPRPASVLLLIVGVVYFVFAAFNLRLASVSSTRAAEYRGQPQFQQQFERTSIRLYWGGFWSMLVGGLCICGRAGLKPGAPVGFAASALFVAIAMCITARTWVAALLHGQVHMAWIEPLLVWPCLAYALIYACRASRRD
jgi:hypothetical protein